MSERNEAISIAEDILNTPLADPDSNESILARQFLRAREALDVLELDIRGKELVSKEKDGRVLDVLILAKRVLLDATKDPYREEAILARYFLRYKDLTKRLEDELKAAYDPMSDLIHANRDEMLNKHEEAVRRINKLLIGGGDNHDIEKLEKIGKILYALSLFHPMHGESWKGWPE